MEQSFRLKKKSFKPAKFRGRLNAYLEVISEPLEKRFYIVQRVKAILESYNCLPILLVCVYTNALDYIFDS